jgi:hypothetical protein
VTVAPASGISEDAVDRKKTDKDNEDDDLLTEEGRLLREHRRLLDSLDSALADVVQLAEDVLPADG